MKSRFFLGVVLALFVTASCSLSEDDSSPVSFVVVNIDSVVLPDVFRLGETHDITIRFEKPSTCHTFSGFEVEPNLNVRTVNAVSAVIPNGDCVDLDAVFEEQVYRFRVTSNGSYVFKFFAGLDDNGVAYYLEHEVFVVE